ncbi:MAG: poly-gamma-glutamate hydrolase family protein [bacterium]|nr:poly-gamma-glutamate hydrolase family protein [bacterium]
MAEVYENFQELSEKETGYSIECEDRSTDFAIVGIHGGQIEPGSEEVVRAIAGTDLSFYLFLGNESRQHITSTHFDEKDCLDLISKSKKVISIHGEKGSEEFVMLGGLDKDLIAKAERGLTDAEFTVIPPASNVRGNEENNLCNRCTSGKGLQIEMSRGLRDSLVQDQARMNAFAQIIRNLTR